MGVRDNPHPHRPHQPPGVLRIECHRQVEWLVKVRTDLLTRGLYCDSSSSDLSAPFPSELSTAAFGLPLGLGGAAFASTGAASAFASAFASAGAAAAAAGAAA
eukprot:CAMPEP_0119537618 /NCGR_PEP_ID=MMETSP1344-20130328/50246_1 /TAXON_ID=236787 /ORGANISM="Florenciella parvula, Strain CCMP2471" /LENGTH=102 /DNA_ID=CAMNT_0007580187 /DNA_START=21 /DNA_END=327 /DNA_ORIENTATION=+